LNCFAFEKLSYKFHFKGSKRNRCIYFRGLEMSARVIRLLRLQQRAPLGELQGGERQQVVHLLKRMVGGGKVVLLEGPAGSGKSAAVMQVCNALPQPKLVASVRGRALPLEYDESLMALLHALGSKAGSKLEARQALTFQLGELKKMGRFVVIVLHDCEVWASNQKHSSLLYMLLDLMQDPDNMYALVLTTRTQDFVESLEKRVQSRLGSQRLVMPPLSCDDAEKIVRHTLTVRAEERDEEIVVWNESVLRLELSLAVGAVHRLQCSNVRLFETLAWLVVSFGGNVDHAWHLLRSDVWRQRIESLSEVEICVLIVMIRPTSGGCPSTLDEAYDIYKKQIDLAKENVFSKKLFERAFCALAEVCEFREWPLGLVEVGEKNHRVFKANLSFFF
jgi:hypothetical protein